MINPIVVDTDLVIDHLRGDERARKLFEKIETGRYLAFYSTITEAEVLSGRAAARSERRRKIERLLALLTRISVNNEIASKTGEIRRRYGLTVPDAIIAATTFLVKGKLATRNRKHFKPVKGLGFVSL